MSRLSSALPLVLLGLSGPADADVPAAAAPKPAATEVYGLNAQMNARQAVEKLYWAANETAKKDCPQVLTLQLLVQGNDLPLPGYREKRAAILL